MAVHSTPISLPPPKRTNVPAERWTEPLLEKGFVPIARLFLRNYSKLHPFPLTSGEALLIVHLMDYKRDKNPPYPAYKTLAGYMGVTDKMVRLHAKRLEEKGYLNRIVRVARSNQFDLTPLFRKLETQFIKKTTGTTAKRKKRNP